MNQPEDSNTVWQWPEFKAFARRLGIPCVPETAITIRLALDEGVRITHDYWGVDITDDAKET